MSHFPRTTPVEPAHRPVPGLLEAVGVAVRRLHHVVQLHHYVGPDRSLQREGGRFNTNFPLDRCESQPVTKCQASSNIVPP